MTIVDVQYSEQSDASVKGARSHRQNALIETLNVKHLHSKGVEKERIEQMLGLLENSRALHPGTGGLVNYRKSMKIPAIKDAVHRNGLPFSPMLIRNGVRLHLAQAWNTSLKPKSLDVIWNRGTWVWLLDQEKLQESILHGLKLLKPGGRMVFVSKSLRDYHYPKLVFELRQLHEKSNLHVLEVPLKAIIPGEPDHFPFKGRYYYDRALIVTKLK